jgi:hypothetical protein
MDGSDGTPKSPGCFDHFSNDSIAISYSKGAFLARWGGNPPNWCVRIYSLHNQFNDPLSDAFLWKGWVG